MFATETRNKLRQGVEKRLAMLGFNDAGVPEVSPKSVSGGAVWKNKPCIVAFHNGFKALEEQIRLYGVGYVVEEEAYTWMHRSMTTQFEGYKTTHLSGVKPPKMGSANTENQCFPEHDHPKSLKNPRQ